MLKAIETENVIKNIIREIVRECANRGFHVSDTCVAYVIKLMVLNPEHGFVNDRPLRRDDIRYLVEVCITVLCQENSPQGEILKMQIFFETQFTSRGKLIAERHNDIKIHIAPLTKEIIETNAKTREDMDKLYRKFVVMSIMSSGLGNPTHASVMKEATVAMQSVFPPSELNQFMALSRKEKEQQIHELTHIVTGIRLFNRDCQKGGEGIEDLPNLLQRAHAATMDTLQSYLQKLMEKTDMLTTALENWMKKSDESEQEEEEEKESSGEGDEEGEEEIEEEEEEMEISKDDLRFISGCLALARQQEVYFRKLLLEADVSCHAVRNLLERLQRRLLQIHDTVRFRTAIPTVQVYPQFIDLAEVWSGLQDEMVILSNINVMATQLQSFVKVLQQVNVPFLKHLLRDCPILTDATRLEATTGLTINPEETQCEVLDPAQISNFDDLPLEFLGFCPWALIEGDGALIPGNPNMGVCHWKGDYYVFSSPEAAHAFGSKPERNIIAALNLVRTRPELIGLLQLQEQIAAEKEVKEEMEEIPEPVLKKDSDMQTEIHPIPKFIDRTYSSSLWEWKRKAIQLANICKCVTTSTQTVNSHMRMSIALQVAPDKDVSCQTKRDNHTNVPIKKNYIFGLKGRRDRKQHVIDLTEPIK